MVAGIVAVIRRIFAANKSYIYRKPFLAMPRYIYQYPDWPNFTWDSTAISTLFGEVRHL